MEPHNVVYEVPETDALRELLRREAHHALNLAAGLPEALDEEHRRALHRMVGDLRDQLARCERAAELVRRDGPVVVAVQREG